MSMKFLEWCLEQRELSTNVKHQLQFAGAGSLYFSKVPKKYMVSKSPFLQGWRCYYRRKTERDADINPSTQTSSADEQPLHGEHETAHRGVGRKTAALLSF